MTADSLVHTPTPSEGPELVQLLTPEGERVEHPDYSIECSDDEIRSLYRDLALGAHVAPAVQHALPANASARHSTAHSTHGRLRVPHVSGARSHRCHDAHPRGHGPPRGHVYRHSHGHGHRHGH
jgi:hypothetical protein